MKKKKMSCPCSCPCTRNFGLLALRITVAAVFLKAGLGKLGDMEMTVNAFEQMRIPLAGFSAWLVAIVETVGGLGILLGVFTRVWALLLAITMLVAVLLVHLGGAWEDAVPAVAMLGSTLALFGVGAGDWRLLKKECACELMKK